MSTFKRRGPVALASILLACVLAILFERHLADVQAADAPPPAPAIPVTVATVQTMDLPVYLTAVGAASPLHAVDVKSQVDGQIVKVLFKEGQTVHAGDVLAEIDRRGLQASLDQASAKLDQDKAALANARLGLARHRQLAQVNATSAQALEAQTALVQELTAQVRGDEAAVNNARVSVDYTTIRAPVSGRVGFRLVDPGNVVKANDTTVLTLVTTSPITVRYSAQQEALPALAAALRKGSVEALALTTDGKSILARGHLSAMDNHVDPQTGTVGLKAQFENADSALWPGQSVVMRTVVDVRRDAIVVPEDAIEHGPEGLFVFVVGKDEKVFVREVKVADVALGYAAVTSGLARGQRVVVQGQYRLTDGARVAATTTSTPSKTNG